MTFVAFIKNTIQFLFKAGLIFWLILAVCELLMPGFVVYYFNLNYLLAIVVGVAFVELLFSANKSK